MVFFNADLALASFDWKGGDVHGGAAESIRFSLIKAAKPIRLSILIGVAKSIRLSILLYDSSVRLNAAMSIICCRKAMCTHVRHFCTVTAKTCFGPVTIVPLHKGT